MDMRILFIRRYEKTTLPINKIKLMQSWQEREWVGSNN